MGGETDDGTVVNLLRQMAMGLGEDIVAGHVDEKGDIVKVHDDLMSATRILVMMAKRFAVGGIPMGNMGGQHWKDYVRKNSSGPDGVHMAHGVDIDPFTGE